MPATTREKCREGGEKVYLEKAELTGPLGCAVDSRAVPNPGQSQPGLFG